jgi:hypothetical protein
MVMVAGAVADSMAVGEIGTVAVETGTETGDMEVGMVGDGIVAGEVAAGMVDGVMVDGESRLVPVSVTIMATTGTVTKVASGYGRLVTVGGSGFGTDDSALA